MKQDDHETLSSSEFSDGASDFHFEQFKGVRDRLVPKNPGQGIDNGQHAVNKCILFGEVLVQLY